MKSDWGIVIVALVVVGVAVWLFETGSDDGDDDDAEGGAMDSGNTDDSGGTAVQNFFEKWAHAIAPAENVNPKYNDPGGLNMQGDMGSVPAQDESGHINSKYKIGVFSTLEAGYNALANVLSKYSDRYGDDTTLLQATAIYIMGPNDPRTISGDLPQRVINEATIVAGRLGVSIYDTLGTLEGK